MTSLEAFERLKKQGLFSSKSNPYDALSLQDLALLLYPLLKDLKIEEPKDSITKPNKADKEDNENYPVYYTTCNKVHVVKLKPDMVDIKVSNTTMRGSSFKNAVNGTFYWAGNPNGLLISRGKILCDHSSHYWRGYPQTILLCNKDDNMYIRRIRTTKELHTPIGEVKWAIGGLGLIYPQGCPNKSDPKAEGFFKDTKGDYSDVLRSTHKTSIGYSYKEKLVYIVVHERHISYTELVEELTQLGLDMAIGLDGGGSSAIRVNNQNKFIAPSGLSRVLNNFIVW